MPSSRRRVLGVAGFALAGLAGTARVGTLDFDDLAESVSAVEGLVAAETKASIRNGDELRRFAEGVVAIADAFEGDDSSVPM
jgi:hypothetical protein